MPTTILNDKEIICHVKAGAMIEPFHAEQVREADGMKIVSFGLSSFGYDVRLADEFKIFVGTADTIISASNPRPDLWVAIKTPKLTLRPGEIAFGRTIEYIKMPVNGAGLLWNKSTHMRTGLSLITSPLEAGWWGTITLELHNVGPWTLDVNANEGIAQLVFFTGERPNVTYADRDGKYQNQVGVTLARL